MDHIAPPPGPPSLSLVVYPLFDPDELDAPLDPLDPYELDLPEAAVGAAPGPAAHRAPLDAPLGGASPSAQCASPLPLTLPPAAGVPDLDALEGFWILEASGVPVGDIKRGVLYWTEVYTPPWAALSINSSGHVELQYGNAPYLATLAVGPRTMLLWNDGDTWIRAGPCVPEGPGPAVLHVAWDPSAAAPLPVEMLNPAPSACTDDGDVVLLAEPHVDPDDTLNALVPFNRSLTSSLPLPQQAAGLGGPLLAPGPPRVCGLSGGDGPLPAWLTLACGSHAPGPFAGRVANPDETFLVFYLPPFSEPPVAQPRGLTLTPHASGLLVKDVRGWAAAENLLAVGDVIVGSAGDTSGDRATLTSRLSKRSGNCYQLTVARGLVAPHEWGLYPAVHDVSI